jgi:AcrR family transcriptional regulator
MTGQQRREQLIAIGRALFAEKGYDGASIEEVSARAGVSKPVVYEHFGGKEGLYAVVVDREMADLLARLSASMADGHAYELVEKAALALLTYIEERTDGFRILARDSPVTSVSNEAPGAGGGFASLLNDVASQVEHILGREFARTGMSVDLAPMYAQMLVGMVAFTGMWWLEERQPGREQVAAHLVNLGWNGLKHLEPSPRPLRSRPSL